ncbi:MAG: hypothetical protein H6678_00310 [Candidatus Delongbacteria bacterium]|nr:hypothetical protein [Candidatus Delongbacteria bacterium]
MVVHIEYQLPESIALIPDTVSIDSVYLSLRMDRDSSRVIFGPPGKTESSRNWRWTCC